MAKLKAILWEMVRSPFFYAYWLVNLSDKAAVFVPADTVPNRVRLPIGALEAVASSACFFLLFARVRRREIRDDGRGALPLFVSQWVFRLRILLAGLPFALLMIWLGHDKLIVDNYHAFEAAPQSEAWRALSALLRAGWAWGLVLLAFCLVDTSGTGVVAAQGRATRSFRNAFRLFPKAAALIAFFFFGELLTGLLEYIAGLELAQFWGAGLGTFVVAIVAIPVSLGFQLGGQLFLGWTYLQRAADKLVLANGEEKSAATGSV